MLGFLEYWPQEAQRHALYTQVPEESDDVSGVAKRSEVRPSGLRSALQKIYQAAPFLLLLNLVVAGMCAAQGVWNVFNRPTSFAPDGKVERLP